MAVEFLNPSKTIGDNLKLPERSWLYNLAIGLPEESSPMNSTSFVPSLLKSTKEISPFFNFGNTLALEAPIILLRGSLLYNSTLPFEFTPLDNILSLF